MISGSMGGNLRGRFLFLCAGGEAGTVGSRETLYVIEGVSSSVAPGGVASFSQMNACISFIISERGGGCLSVGAGSAVADACCGVGTPFCRGVDCPQAGFGGCPRGIPALPPFLTSFTAAVPLGLMIIEGPSQPRLRNGLGGLKSWTLALVVKLATEEVLHGCDKRDRDASGVLVSINATSCCYNSIIWYWVREPLRGYLGVDKWLRLKLG